MRGGIGISTFTAAIQDLWERLDMPPTELEVECFAIVDKSGYKVRAFSSGFKTPEDYVDEAWERNR